MSESFLNSICLFVFGHLLFWDSFLHLFVFVHFNNGRVSLSSSLSTTPYLLSVTPTPLSVSEFLSLTMLHRFFRLMSNTRYQSLFPRNVVSIVRISPSIYQGTAHASTLEGQTPLSVFRDSKFKSEYGE
jgi:hypothetical protein